MDEDFRSPAGRGRNACITLFIFCAASLFFGASSALTLMTVNALRTGATPILGADTVDSISRVAGLILVMANLLAMVFCSLWIYRSNKNAHTLSDGMSVSPGWAIGWFAIPFANLLRPFTGIRETWQVSMAPEDPFDVPVPGIMRLWWGCWLLSQILGNLSFRLALSKSLDALIASMWIDLLSTPFDLCAALTFAYIIKRISEMQSGTVDVSIFE